MFYDSSKSYEQYRELLSGTDDTDKSGIYKYNSIPYLSRFKVPNDINIDPI